MRHRLLAEKEVIADGDEIYLVKDKDGLETEWWAPVGPELIGTHVKDRDDWPIRRLLTDQETHKLGLE